jgi:hypothetical protein
VAQAIQSDPRENSFSRDLICACVSMPMTTCQPGHRLSCPILLVLAWLVLYGLQYVRNGEARNRSTMRTLAPKWRGYPLSDSYQYPQFTILGFFLLKMIPIHSEDPPTGRHSRWTRNRHHQQCSTPTAIKKGRYIYILQTADTVSPVPNLA